MKKIILFLLAAVFVAGFFIQPASAINNPSWSANSTKLPSPQTYNTGTTYGFQINWIDADGNFANATFQLGRPNGVLTNYTIITSPAVYRWNYTNYNNWSYRKTIIINGSTSLLNDYQVNISINSTGMGSNFNWSTYGNDTRFTWLNSSNGLEQNVSFWIETWTYSGSLGSASIWVKVPNITASTVANTTIYMYYGNPSATYNNSLGGNNTFLFFDDIESGSIDGNKWDIKQAYGSTGIRTDDKYGAYGLGTDNGPGQGCCYPTTWYFDHNHFLMKLPDGSGVQYLASFKAKRWKSTTYQSTGGLGFGTDLYNIFDLPFDNVWRNYDVILKRTNGTNLNYIISQDGVWSAPGDYAFTQAAIFIFGVQTGHVGPSDNSVYSRGDDFRVRKYASPEPNVLSIGEQITNYINFTQDQLGMAGTYNITWFGIDTLGNQNASDTVNYIIDFPRCSSNSTSCVSQAYPFSGWVFDTGAGTLSGGGNIKMQVKETGDVFATTFSGGYFSINPSFCLVPGKIYSFVLQAESGGNIAYITYKRAAKTGVSQNVSCTASQQFCSFQNYPVSGLVLDSSTGSLIQNGTAKISVDRTGDTYAANFTNGYFSTTPQFCLTPGAEYNFLLSIEGGNRQGLMTYRKTGKS